MTSTGTKHEKFKTKFTKKLFRRPLNQTSFLHRLKYQERHWKGILLAIVTIAFISCLILLSALFVTEDEIKIHYDRLSVEELLWIDQSEPQLIYYFDRGENDRARNFYRSSGIRTRYFLGQLNIYIDHFIFANRNGSVIQINVGNPNLNTFNDALRSTEISELDISDIDRISGIWPNSQRTAWLIEYSGKKVGLQEQVFRYLIVISESHNRIYVQISQQRQLNPPYFRLAIWGPNEFSIIVHHESNLYYTEDILKNIPNGLFHCLSCHLPQGPMYGYPGWIYRQYFQYAKHEGLWFSDDSTPNYLIALTTDEKHLVKLSIPFHEEQESRFMSQNIPVVYLQANAQTNETRTPIVDLVVFDLVRGSNVKLSFGQMQSILYPNNLELNLKDQQRTGFYITEVSWFNSTGFLVSGLMEYQRCGFIQYCSPEFDQNTVRCQHIWYQCSNKNWLDIRKSAGISKLWKNGDNSFYVRLPFISHGTVTFQLAQLQIIPNSRNRIQWLTEFPFNVHQLLNVNGENLMFIASVKPASRHIYRLNQKTLVIHCLTCIQMEDLVMNNNKSVDLSTIHDLTIPPMKQSDFSLDTELNATYKQLSYSVTSSNGLVFSTQWNTGFEPLGTYGLQDAPTRKLINRLTGKEIHTSDSDNIDLVQIQRISTDSGVSLWKLNFDEQLDSENIKLRLLWHSFTTRYSCHLNNYSNTEIKPHNRQRRSTSSRGPKPHPAKQQPLPGSVHRLKVKAGFLNTEPVPLTLFFPKPVFGDRPVPHHDERMIDFTQSKAKPTKLAKDDVESEEKPTLLIKSGAIVRFWFPPFLNERHVKTYPLLVDIRNIREHPPVENTRLMDQLKIFMAGTLDVIVLQVIDWFGQAATHVERKGYSAEVENYQLLLRAIYENYHYIDRNKTALIGSHGPNAHLTAYIMSSTSSNIIPKCGVLLSPIANWALHESTHATRLYGSYLKNELTYMTLDLTKMAERFRHQDLLLVHGTADTMVPFFQTMELVRTFSQENIGFHLWPIFDADHSYDKHHAMILKKIAGFVYDCVYKSSVRWTMPELNSQVGKGV